ncbi:MAG: DUF5103 domain-containing protein, partial [Bacteroidota bacterium]|nr:DUF5103 domain-containing protein [Bacteroidota bacterium]
MKRLLLVCFFVATLCVSAQEHYRTMPLAENIKTLQVGIDGQKLSLPVIRLDDTDRICVKFDEMSHDRKNYYYSIRHCNADWTLSNITEMEAIDGSSTGTINDFESSFNTTFLYTHYAIRFPNDQVKFKISGNYRVTIYEDNNPDKVVAVACFSVVEPKVSIEGTIRGNTDLEINRRYQQLDFSVDNSRFPIKDVF